MTGSATGQAEAAVSALVAGRGGGAKEGPLGTALFSSNLSGGCLCDRFTIYLPVYNMLALSSIPKTVENLLCTKSIYGLRSRRPAHIRCIP